MSADQTGNSCKELPLEGNSCKDYALELKYHTECSSDIEACGKRFSEGESSEGFPSQLLEEEKMKMELILQYQSLCTASRKLSQSSKQKVRVVKSLKRKISQIKAENVLLKRAIMECNLTEQ